MAQPIQRISVEVDTFRVASESLIFSCQLDAALAVCVHDDTQAAGGLLHLRYVATSNDKPLDLTDNTLSSGLLLMDRFCKELRAIGARKQSWRVHLIGHTPDHTDLDAPAATVLDLVKAYFADGRLPVKTEEIKTRAPVDIQFNPREGDISTGGASSSTAQRTVRL